MKRRKATEGPIYLKQWRAVRGFMTTDYLAALAGVHRTTIVRIELGYVKPTKRIMEKLAMGLDIEPVSLYVDPFLIIGGVFPKQ